jgi:tRNA(Ile)-lysidine synthase TilS/MesJ
MIRLVSVSGGKDSTACLLLALERHPREEVRAVFADTGNVSIHARPVKGARRR